MRSTTYPTAYATMSAPMKITVARVMPPGMSHSSSLRLMK